MGRVRGAHAVQARHDLRVQAVVLRGSIWSIQPTRLEVNTIAQADGGRCQECSVRKLSVEDSRHARADACGRSQHPLGAGP